MGFSSALLFRTFLNAMIQLNLFARTHSKLLVAASLLMSSTIAIAPAHADSIKNATIGGTAATTTDYILYDSNATQTFANPNANLQTILGGTAANPTGNVELAAKSEQAGFDFTKNTSLDGTIGGHAISISSLTASDWSSSYKDTTFGQYWFNSALTANGFGSMVGTTSTSLFNMFKNNGGLQRFSDPNVSYVNQDTNNVINIGLAGHYDASSLFTKSIDQYLANTALTSLQRSGMMLVKTQLSGKVLQASEVVKTTYNGKTDFGFSFKATHSGLVEKSDGISHNGNYVISLQGIEPVKKRVPEPSIVLGLVGLGGLAVRKLRRG
jgi:hypothetical protein